MPMQNRDLRSFLYFSNALCTASGTVNSLWVSDGVSCPVRLTGTSATTIFTLPLIGNRMLMQETGALVCQLAVKSVESVAVQGG